MASFEDSAGAAKTVKLVSQENEEFTVSVEVAKMSVLMSSMIGDEDGDAENEVPLPNVTAPILSKVIEFCKHYAEEKMTEFEKPLKNADLSQLVQPFYSDFICSQDNDSLYHLTLAANYLDISPLLDLCSARIASFIKGKTVEEIRTNLNIVNDFTPEEEAQVREENKWADDL